ncbi:MAG: hypothetical protein SGPRY_001587, partial [Prymnesium sp.]
MLDSVLPQVVQRRMLDFVLEAESTAQTTDADGSSTQPCSAASATSSSESMGSVVPSARGENGDKIGSGPQKRGAKKRPTQSESQTRQREEDLLLQIEREKQLLLEKQAQLALRVSSSVGRAAPVMSTDSAPPPSSAQRMDGMGIPREAARAAVSSHSDLGPAEIKAAAAVARAASSDEPTPWQVPTSYTEQARAAVTGRADQESRRPGQQQEGGAC